MSYEKSQSFSKTATAKKNCALCGDQICYVDYKNLKILKDHLTYYGKIQPRKRTGACLKHQKMIARAIKNSRFISLLPFAKKL
jgi:small subunit ribosomal protein S18